MGLKNSQEVNLVCSRTTQYLLLNARFSIAHIPFATSLDVLDFLFYLLFSCQVVPLRIHIATVIIILLLLIIVLMLLEIEGRLELLLYLLIEQQLLILEHKILLHMLVVIIIRRLTVRLLLLLLIILHMRRLRLHLIVLRLRLMNDMRRSKALHSRLNLRKRWRRQECTACTRLVVQMRRLYI